MRLGAVSAGNDSPYGLSTAVFTNHLDVVGCVAMEVDTALVAVNWPAPAWDVDLPFGEFKGSGSMSKVRGTEGLHFNAQVEPVAIRDSR